MDKKIHLYDKTFRTFIPNAEIESAIDKVAERLNADFKDSGEIPVILCTLNGAIMFTAELMKRLDFDCELVSMKLSSYSGTRSTGKVRQVMGLTGDISGKTVIIVEDIVDSGMSMHYLLDTLKTRKPASVRLLTLLDKPDRRRVELQADYIGFTIPDEFVIGYGLDYAEKYRNLPDVCVLSPKVYM